MKQMNLNIFLNFLTVVNEDKRISKKFAAEKLICSLSNCLEKFSICKKTIRFSKE